MANIVVLEDDFRLLDLYRDVLGFQGYSIQTMTTVDDLEDYLSENQVALCICDLRLGLMDGKSTIEILKALKSQYHVPMILLSAQMMVYEDACREAGFHNLLMKPVPNNVLVDMVKKVLATA